MKEARHGHSCGVINYKEIIVVGGRNALEVELFSAEVFSLLSMQWEQSTALNFLTAGSIQYGTTVLIFGRDANIYQFDEVNQGWAMRDEKLTTIRSNYLAIPITGTGIDKGDCMTCCVPNQKCSYTASNTTLIYKICHFC